nr:MAG TPA: hypothetical protein [Caudoviricetes sp.]
MPQKGLWLFGQTMTAKNRNRNTGSSTMPSFACSTSGIMAQGDWMRLRT